ncbi:MAG: hypothetical protein V3U29_03355, partial [Phycisphaeraceae bacterium]
LLMAAVALRIGRSLLETGRAGLWSALLKLHVVALIAAAAGLWLWKPQQIKPPTWAVAGFVVVGLIFLAALSIRRVRRGMSVEHSAVALTLFAALFMGTMSVHGTLWRAKRFDHRRFALRIASIVKPTDPLLGWWHAWDIERYYIDRNIPMLRDEAALASVIREHSFAWVLVDLDNVPVLPDDLHKQVELRDDFSDPGDDDDRVELWRLTLVQDPDRGHAQPAGQ